MIPLGGLSSVAHLLILLARFVEKAFGFTGQDLKEKFLRWGLRVNPRFCLALFGRDSLAQVVTACLIIAVIFSLAFASVEFIIKNSFKSNSNFSLAANIIETRLVLAKGKTEIVQKNEPKFIEIPFAREILQADYNEGDLMDSSLNQNILPVNL